MWDRPYLSKHWSRPHAQRFALNMQAGGDAVKGLASAAENGLQYAQQVRTIRSVCLLHAFHS